MLKVLKDKGCRLTPQRLGDAENPAAGSAGHPALSRFIEQIKMDVPTTSLATIYKTMSLLKEMGQVLELTLTSVGTALQTATDHTLIPI